MTHKRVSQCRLPRSVRPHNGVNFALIDGQREAFENFLIFNANVQILYFKLRHNLVCSWNSPLARHFLSHYWRFYQRNSIIAGLGEYVNIYDIFLVY